MCLSIGTPKSNELSIFPYRILIVFLYPKIYIYNSLIIMFINIGTPKNINFPFGTNGKLKVLGVPKFKHFWVN